MGCDIHLHTEIKVNGKWEHYNAPDVSRDYALFAKMAGVRARPKDGPPIAKPRGLPSDMSLVTALDWEQWRADGHSASWLNAEEVCVLEAWYQAHKNTPFVEREWGYFFGSAWSGFCQYPEDVPAGVENIRFVFWFDN